MITLDALLYLIFGLLTGRLFYAPLLRFYLADKNSGVMHLLTLVNLAVDLLTIVGFLVIVFMARKNHEQAQRQRTWVLAGLMIMTMTITMVHHSIVRASHPEANNLTHDGLVQTEVAAQLLLHGKNPYTADYRGTVAEQPLIQNHVPIPVAQSPLQHYVYPPLIPLLVVPSVALANLRHTVPEGQYIFLLLFVAVSWLLVRQAKTWPERRLLLVLTIGNPFLWLYIVAGYNDSVAAGLAIATATFLHRRQWKTAGLLFGLTLAAKQTWWIMIPLWGVWLWKAYQTADHQNQTAIRRSALLTLTTLAVLYGPFLISNPSALYDDLIRFVSATSSAYYPISGSTFWQFLALSGNPWQPTAHSLSQEIFGLPLLAGMMWWMTKRPTAVVWLTSAVVLLLVLSVLNRFAYDNYFSAIVFVGIAAYVLERPVAEVLANR